MLLQLATTGLVMAQDLPALDAQMYRTPIDASHTMWTNDTDVGPDRYSAAQLMLMYTNDPLVFVPNGDGEVVELVSNTLQFNFIAYSTIDRFRFGFDLPMYALAMSDVADGGAGFGDVGLDVKAHIVDQTKFPVGLAGAIRLTLPSSTVDAPLGAAGPVIDLEGMLDRMVPLPLGELLLASNLGARIGPKVTVTDVELNDAFIFRAGAGNRKPRDIGLASVDVVE